MKLKRKLIISGLIVAVLAIVGGAWHVAHSQDVPSHALVVDYVIHMTQDDIDIIGSGLAVLPYGKARKTVEKIQAQINSQELEASMKVKAAQDAAAAKSKPKK